MFKFVIHPKQNNDWDKGKSYLNLMTSFFQHVKINA
jgi:hypothetical protein